MQPMSVVYSLFTEAFFALVTNYSGFCLFLTNFNCFNNSNCFLFLFGSGCSIETNHLILLMLLDVLINLWLDQVLFLLLETRLP